MSSKHLGKGSQDLKRGSVGQHIIGNRDSVSLERAAAGVVDVDAKSTSYVVLACIVSILFLVSKVYLRDRGPETDPLPAAFAGLPARAVGLYVFRAC